MSDVRLYHADSSGEFRRLLAQTARQSDGIRLIGGSADGREAEQAVREGQPDVLILSLTLQFLDGMELIRRVQTLPHRPRILVLSYMVRDFCIEEAMRCGADYFMLKPCTLPLVLDRVRELAQSDSSMLCGAASPGVGAPDEVVQALIGRMGVSPELSGFRYAAEAVRITLLQGAASMTKELYPQIASAYCVTVPAVERAIRHAIDAAWKHPASAARRMLFPGLGRPSNARFILRIAGACETSSPESLYFNDP